MRTAKVKLGEVELMFDGERFTSENDGAASILNGALRLVRGVGVTALTSEPVYWPDPFKGLVELIAKHCAAEVVSIDPREPVALVDGAFY